MKSSIQGDCMHALIRRAKYIGRFIYWTVRHCSTEHAAWVCEFEGYAWRT